MTDEVSLHMEYSTVQYSTVRYNTLHSVAGEMSLDMERQMVRPGESSAADVALEWLDSCVFSLGREHVMSCQDSSHF